MEAQASNSTTRPPAASGQPLGGAGGPVVDVLLMMGPLVFLVFVTLSRRFAMPTRRSVPLAAGTLYLLKLCYLVRGWKRPSCGPCSAASNGSARTKAHRAWPAQGAPSNPVTAALLQGVLLGLVPLR